MSGLTIQGPSGKDLKKANLTQCYDNERTYFVDGATGKHYSTADMRIEIDPKTFAPVAGGPPIAVPPPVVNPPITRGR